MTDNKQFKNKISRRQFILNTTGIVSLVASGGIFYAYHNQEETKKELPKDLDGNSVSLDIPITQKELQNMNIEDLTTDNNHIKIKDLGLDSPTALMNSVDGIINPPDATKTYLLRDYGTTLEKPSEGTIYAVAHSLKTGRGPGNYLFNIGEDKTLIQKGQKIEIHHLTYTVQDIQKIDKTELAKNQEIWTNTPDRLVFITCLQRTHGKSLQNLITIATRDK